MLAAHAGCEAEVAAVTEAAMRGELDFERVAARSGSRCSRASTRGALDEVYDELVLAPGARTLVRTLQAARLPLRDRLRRLHPDHRPARRRPRHPLLARANELEIVDGTLTGRIVGDVVDRAGKAAGAAPVRRRGRRLRGGRRSRSATAPTTSTCSTPPASASPTTPSRWCSDAADTSVNVPYLDAIMYLLGICREEIEAADAERRHRHARSARLSRGGQPAASAGRRRDRASGRRRSARPTWKPTSRPAPSARSAQSPSTSKTASGARWEAARPSARHGVGVAVAVVEQLGAGTPRSGCGRRTPATVASGSRSRSRSSAASGPAV